MKVNMKDFPSFDWVYNEPDASYITYTSPFLDLYNTSSTPNTTIQFYCYVSLYKSLNKKLHLSFDPARIIQYFQVCSQKYKNCEK